MYKAILNPQSMRDPGWLRLVFDILYPRIYNQGLIKLTKRTIGGTKLGREFEALEPRLRLGSEQSFSEQTKKSTLASRLMGIISAKVNNRLAIFRW